ncbi:MAG: metalloregulator ArsR/SmtB family transcription factor [Candidatus Riflebacteria bacterium]|nr:metalloregulator ArsR/SmtB family transcription factor [Candidatus Riflebacteria bacterium]
MKISSTLAIMEAMADHSRLMILQALLENSLCVEELARSLNLSSSTISFHLKKLETAQLVRKERSQYYSVFQLNKEIFHFPLIEFLQFDNPEKEVQQDREFRNRQKVLRAFFEGSKLIRLPAQEKKKRIILEELSKAFSPGKKYSEPEVNSILGSFNEDYCTLRRLLIGEGLMGRIRDTYWAISPEEPSGNERATDPAAKGKCVLSSDRRKEKMMDRKKELKRAYKETPIPAGIFQIKNLENGKIFLGSSMNLPGAFNRHQFQLVLGVHKFREFQADWKEFGQECFEFRVLEEIPLPEDGSKISPESVKELEKKWLTKLRKDGDKIYEEM